MRKQDRLAVHGGYLHYTLEGEGEPLVMLHGNFNDHQIWDELASALAARYRVIRYDLRGYGQSSTPNAPFSHAEDLIALFRHLKLNEAVLIGSSMGGAAAIDFALAYPERAKTLILTAPSVGGKPYPPKMVWKGIINYWNMRWRGPAKAIEAFIRDPYWSYFFPPSRDSEAYRLVVDNVSRTQNFCRIPAKWTAAGSGSAIQRIGDIAVPALVVIGNRDHPFNIAVAEQLASGMKHGTIATMNGCGHLPFVEEPSRFLELAERFLTAEHV